MLQDKYNVTEIYPAFFVVNHLSPDTICWCYLQKQIECFFIFIYKDPLLRASSLHRPLDTGSQVEEKKRVHMTTPVLIYC